MDTGEKAHSSATTLAFGGRRPGSKKRELSYKDAQTRYGIKAGPVLVWYASMVGRIGAKAHLFEFRGPAP
jgi:hypothetical protein